MDRDNVIRKVQHLLTQISTSRGATEAEAELALSKAQELMLKHNISHSDVEQFVPNEKGENWVARVVWQGKGWPWDLRYTVNIATSFFFVRAVYGGSPKVGYCEVEFFGDEDNVEIAALVLQFLHDAFRKSWKAYRKREKVNHSFARGYYEGLAIGLQQKLGEERKRVLKNLEGPERSEPIPVENALSIVRSKEDKLKQAYTTHYREQGITLRPMNPPKDIENYGGFEQGLKDGKEIEIDVKRPKGKLTGTKTIED